MTKFTNLNLHKNLLKSLDKMGFEEPTAIQAQFIPLALDGKDVMASAQTGSGKTGAFLLPTFQKNIGKKGQGPKALVLTPTRELAAQVMKVAEELAKFSGVTVGVVTGGAPFFKQRKMLSEGVDILVATPGRLIDLMQQKMLTLDHVETLVLDEADRMLDMGFAPDVFKITEACKNPARQTLLLSATLEGAGIEQVASQVLKKPVRVELTSATQRHENIQQYMYRAKDFHHKQKILEALLQAPEIWQVIIFCGTKVMTERLVEQLREHGWEADYLHGDMRQSARNSVIRRMQGGKTRILAATDVAARGLDIKDMSHVINFDLPQNSEDYIHRIGRVGRAGKKGVAFSLVAAKQWRQMQDIEKMMGCRVEEQSVPGLEYVPTGKSSEKSGSKNGSKGNSKGGFRSGAKRGAKPEGNRSEGGRFKKPDSENQKSFAKKRPAQRQTEEGYDAPRKGKRSPEEFGSEKGPQKFGKKFERKSGEPRGEKGTGGFDKTSRKPRPDGRRSEAGTSARGERGEQGFKPRSGPQKRRESFAEGGGEKSSERKFGDKKSFSKSSKPAQGKFGKKPPFKNKERDGDARVSSGRPKTRQNPRQSREKP